MMFDKILCECNKIHWKYIPISRYIEISINIYYATYFSYCRVSRTLCLAAIIL